MLSAPHAARCCWHLQHIAYTQAVCTADKGQLLQLTHAVYTRRSLTAIRYVLMEYPT